MQEIFSGKDDALDKLSQLASVADGGSVRRQLSNLVDEFKITTKLPALQITVQSQSQAQEHSSELLAAVSTVTQM